MNKLKLRESTDCNYVYHPVIFETENQLIEVKTKLEKENVNLRRYFYPSLEELPYVKSNSCPVAKDIAQRVLCLPLYDSLSIEDLSKIVSTINE